MPTVTFKCEAFIAVPDDISVDDAEDWAKDHINEMEIVDWEVDDIFED